MAGLAGAPEPAEARMVCCVRYARGPTDAKTEDTRSGGWLSDLAKWSEIDAMTSTFLRAKRSAGGEMEGGAGHSPGGERRGAGAWRAGELEGEARAYPATASS